MKTILKVSLIWQSFLNPTNRLHKTVFSITQTFVTLPLLLELNHSLEMYVLGRFHAKPGKEIRTLLFTQY